MITVTRLNKESLIINAELIKTIEATPDTIITLLNGERLIVKEPVKEIVKRAIEYGRSIRAFVA
ncbi:MAG: flagellar FlbD family protein [Phycisphaerales bacterium]|nr:flagellar FlbD family protein [Phycisphaerales bacterium]